LAFNMITFYFFLWWLTFGQFVVCNHLFWSLIFGSLLTIIFHKDDYNYRAIGASGAVTGVLYSAILLQPDMMLGIFFIIPMPAYLLNPLLAVFYLMRAKNDKYSIQHILEGLLGDIWLIWYLTHLVVDHTLW
jgi:membrane associated rhomboid family serine protease